jgi:DNA-binding MarR family transcriptional regulator
MPDPNRPSEPRHSREPVDLAKLQLRRRTGVAAALGVGSVELLALLLVLKADDGVLQATLASEADLSHAGCTAMLLKLERDGLVERRDDPPDCQSRTVQLTAECRQRLAAALARAELVAQSLDNHPAPALARALGSIAPTTEPEGSPVS